MATASRARCTGVPTASGCGRGVSAVAMMAAAERTARGRGVEDTEMAGGSEASHAHGVEREEAGEVHGR